ncbi:hypothetical protein BGW80DRAFT_1450998 [Lactifluus volemus]|nr:hypothetical protein BGW80DRAFT_1450998 [Lactifluus volemus]
MTRQATSQGGVIDEKLASESESASGHRKSCLGLGSCLIAAGDCSRQAEGQEEIRECARANGPLPVTGEPPFSAPVCAPTGEYLFTARRGYSSILPHAIQVVLNAHHVCKPNYRSQQPTTSTSSSLSPSSALGVGTPIPLSRAHDGMGLNLMLCKMGADVGWSHSGTLHGAAAAMVKPS